MDSEKVTSDKINKATAKSFCLACGRKRGHWKDDLECPLKAKDDEEEDEQRTPKPPKHKDREKKDTKKFGAPRGQGT